MYYDPDQQPIRSTLSRYRKWIIGLTLISPIGSMINELVLRRSGMWSSTTSVVLRVLLACCIALCLATVWITEYRASWLRKLGECATVLIHMCWINAAIGFTILLIVQAAGINVGL